MPDKPAPPLKQLVDDGILAIIAGADTVASALTSILYCVLTHPETYSKLRDEVDRFYPQGEDAFDPKYYREMTYLHAVMYVTCMRRTSRYSLQMWAATKGCDSSRPS